MRIASVFTTCAIGLCTLSASAMADSAVSSPLNELSEVERLSGWKLLFDGQTTEGWRNYRRDTISKGWKVKDGLLAREGLFAGDIITEEKYGEFELSLEFRISTGGNSGVMFRVTEEAPQPWHTGPEVQILDNAKGHDPQKTGWLYQLYQPKKPNWRIKIEKAAGLEPEPTLDTARPAGEWNHLVIRVTDNESRVYLNGVSYYRFQIGSDDWNKRVAKSKFSKYAGFGKAEEGHICLQDHGNDVAFRNIKIRDLSRTPPDPQHGKLAVGVEPAFPNLNFADWEGVDENGKIEIMRPLVMTAAASESERLYVATQRGVIHTFKNDPDARQTDIFFDIEDQVKPFYGSGANEEGLLGLAFHPDYPTDPRFFVYYTKRVSEPTSIVSSFRVSADNPLRADPKSEQVLMTIDEPFQNHNGGSIEFGPDGFLYIGLGDGGSANDPQGNGQNLSTLLGSILRIDVDSTSADQPYGIPADNPFVEQTDARPEIFAYGFRNPWRIGFDPKTGDLWAADVGQDYYEEIDVVRAGGNYGWNVREGAHPFGADGEPAKPEYIDPVWEYDHTAGKSITGGYVFRSDRVPELDGRYLYADYVTGKLWALDYDPNSGTVRSNDRIPTKNMPVLAFGQLPGGEVLFAIPTAGGQGIYRFVSKQTDE
ncbi:family 16 glycoside hydrolase [Stratiformator vulcanicus]|uniref:Soluble aldose sugar dehydrogenase YliI n=1 Tax=Stratiformator vulcanicus TaxID=2527980 RepID=A0A517R543_9PLAN|nr:family 16 glycoside hydrolase [Stratiformator vulcanicus]QDT39016.1 Soluble aldose sugar dehydrogenase YliI precursor [Stratiformator vulcanicus]